MTMGLPVAWDLACGYQRDADEGIRPVLAIHDNPMAAALVVAGWAPAVANVKPCRYPSAIPSRGQAAGWAGIAATQVKKERPADHRHL